MEHLIELLDNAGVGTHEGAERAGTLSPSQLGDLLAEAIAVLPEASTISNGHTFLANSELSGFPFPCANIACRISNLRRTGSFAVLYADEVTVQEPFSNILSRSDFNIARELAVEAFQLIASIRPLIDAGYIRICRQALHFCSEHTPQIITDGLADELSEELGEYLFDTLDIAYDPDGFMVVSGLDGEADHSIFYQEEYDGPLLKSVDRHGFQRLPAAERRRQLGIAAGPIMDDIIQQSVYAKESGARYLTNRQTDVRLLGVGLSQEERLYNSALIDGLSHSVPSIAEATWGDLIKLRQNEGEAFEVYRDSLSELLRDLDLADAGSIKTAFVDRVLPELHTIDRTIQIARRTLFRHLATDFVIGAGMVTVGLSTGLIAPISSTLFAQLGGAAGLFRAGQRVGEYFNETGGGESNDFYFLWRAAKGEQ